MFTKKKGKTQSDTSYNNSVDIARGAMENLLFASRSRTDAESTISGTYERRQFEHNGGTPGQNLDPVNQGVSTSTFTDVADKQRLLFEISQSMHACENMLMMDHVDSFFIRWIDDFKNEEDLNTSCNCEPQAQSHRILDDIGANVAGKSRGDDKAELDFRLEYLLRLHKYYVSKCTSTSPLPPPPLSTKMMRMFPPQTSPEQATLAAAHDPIAKRLSETLSRLDIEYQKRLSILSPCQSSYIAMLMDAILNIALKLSNVSISSDTYGTVVAQLIVWYVGSAFSSHAQYLNILSSVPDGKIKTVLERLRRNLGTAASHATPDGASMMKKMTAFAALARFILIGDRKTTLDDLDGRIVPAVLKMCKKIVRGADAINNLVQKRMVLVRGLYGSTGLELFMWAERKDHLPNKSLMRGHWLLMDILEECVSKSLELNAANVQSLITLERVKEIIFEVCKNDQSIADTFDSTGILSSMTAQIGRLGFGISEEMLQESRKKAEERRKKAEERRKNSHLVVKFKKSDSVKFDEETNRFHRKMDGSGGEMKWTPSSHAWALKSLAKLTDSETKTAMKTELDRVNLWSNNILILRVTSSSFVNFNEETNRFHNKKDGTGGEMKWKPSRHAWALKSLEKLTASETKTAMKTELDRVNLWS